jgi:Right handed beta helix region
MMHRTFTAASIAVMSISGGVLSCEPTPQPPPNGPIVYVSPDRGDDGNSGTASSPKRTVYAASESAAAGTTIRVLGGAYDTSQSGWYTPKGGAPGAPLVIEPNPGESVTLRSGGDAACLIVGADWTTVRGFTCSGARGLASYDASHVVFERNTVVNLTDYNAAGIAADAVDKVITDVTVANNRVENVPGSGIRVGASRLGSATDVDIVGNTVLNNNLSWTDQSLKGGWGSGIVAVGVDGARIDGNDVRKSHGEAINCPLSKRCEVRNNVAVDAYNVLYYADNTSDSIWENNQGWVTGDPAFTRDYGGGPGFASGVQMANESSWFTGPANPSARNTVRNNTFSDVANGFGYGGYENAAAGLKDTTVTGNRFLNVRNCGVSIDESPGNSNLVTEPNEITLRPGAALRC